MNYTTAANGSTSSWPKQVHFLLNDKCNAKCVFCGGDYYRSRSNRRITVERFKIMAANLRLERFKGIVLAGAGDPLICPDFLPIVEYARSAYPHLFISITTNGIALSEEIGQALVRNGVGMLNISINAARRDTYHRLMQVDEFDRVVANAERFRDICRAAGRGPYFQLSCAINRLNIEELPQLVELAHRLDAKLVNLFYTRFYPEKIRNLNIEAEEFLLPDQESLYFHQELSDAMVLQARALAAGYGIQLLHEPLFREPGAARPCVWPETELMVGFGGEVYPCGGGELHFKERVASGEYDFGNALNQTIEQFWNNDSYRELRVSRQRGEPCPIPECRECANLMRHSDVRSHILDWQEFKSTEPTDDDQQTVPPAPQPLVSVIVPTYNRPEMLQETLQSILAQTYRNFEIIVVNDMGQDVAPLVERFNDENRITYVRHGRNRGLAASRNTGIKLARGKYIAYLDDDDLFYPDHLETLVEFLEGSNFQVAYTDGYRALQELKDGRYVLIRRDLEYSFDFDPKLILKTNYVPVLCFMHARSCLEEVGLFDESLRSHEDWDLWMRMSRKYRFHHIRRITCEYSWREDQTKMTFAKHDDMMATMAIVAERGHCFREEDHQSEVAAYLSTQEGTAFAAYRDLQPLLAAGNQAGAIEALTGLLVDHPEFSLAHNDLGVLYHQTGDAEQALHHYRRASELEPDNIVFRKNLADFLFMERGERDEAVGIYGRIIGDDPNDEEALYTLGQMSLVMNCPKEARLFFERVLALDPTDPAARQKLEALTAEGTSSCTATPAVQEKQQAIRAKEKYRQALSIAEEGKVGAATAMLEELLTEDPKSAVIHNDLGVLHGQQGGHGKALAHYREAVRLAPGNVTFRKNLADFCYIVIGNAEEALGIYVQLLGDHPGDTEVLLNLARICLDLGQVDDAGFFCRRAIELEPWLDEARDILKIIADHPAADTDNTPIVMPEGAVSIIIVTYNSAKTLGPCLESVARTLREGDEVIIVDNASSDETVAIDESFITGRTGFRLIRNQENVGFSAGTNIGISESINPFVILLNPDTTVTRGWIERLLSRFADPGVGAVGPVSDHVAGLQQLQLHLLKPPPDLLDYETISRELVQRNNGKNVETKLLTGFCLALRRDLLDRLGFLDESLFLGNDDLELCWRLRVHGYRLLVASDTFVHHEGQQSFNTVPKETTSRLVQESTDALYAKLVTHYGPGRTPTPLEIWGMEWFIPSDPNFNATVGIGDLLRLPCPVESLSPAIPAATPPGLTSLVILTFNQLEFTKECVASIQRHTQEPYEIIFVDNGSTDGTVAWLRSLTVERQNFSLIENGTNLGFAKGCNQGIAESRGNSILLLNNDVVVTEGWLAGLLECLESVPDAGIVGPMTNNISGIQRIAGAPGSPSSELDAYARSFREKNRNRRIASRRIVGFCMLFKKELIERIGLLDENFGTGNFEDDDFCLRAALAGYHNIIAGDVFIHHYGSQSFRGNQIDYGATLGGNKQLFDRKWGGGSLDEETARRLVVLTALERGKELFHKGNLAGAVEILLQNGIRHSPREARAYHALSEILLEAKQYQEALDTIGEAPATDSDPHTLELAGYALDGLDRRTEARLKADRALALQPRSAGALNLQGICTYKDGDTESAVDFFHQAIAADPSFGEPHTNLGVIKWTEGAHEEALEFLERGFVLSPEIPDIISSYHGAVTALETFARAEILFREAKALYPLHKQLAYLFIDILLKQGKSAEAFPEIEAALANFGIDDGILAAAVHTREQAGIEAKGLDTTNSISLCMIVKNEEQNLVAALHNLKPLVDEIIVVDTGSSDRTKEVAAAFGAAVYDFAWTGDFSAARNFSLAKANGNWLLVMDADEAIAHGDHEYLRCLLKETPGKRNSFSFVTRNYVHQVNAEGWVANDGRYHREEAGSGWIPSEKVRLFPNDDRIRFENPVHELLETSLRQAGIAVAKCPVPVHHYGKLDQEREQAKREQYYQLGIRKLEEFGEDPTALAELAIQAGELRRFDEAIALWERYLRLVPRNASAYFNVGYAHMEQGDFVQGLTASRKALEIKPDFRDAAYNCAICEVFTGHPEKAIVRLTKLLKKHPDYPSAIAMLSVAYGCTGDQQKVSECLAHLRRLSIDTSAYLLSETKKLYAAGMGKGAVTLLEAAARETGETDEIMQLLAQYRGAGN